MHFWVYQIGYNKTFFTSHRGAWNPSTKVETWKSLSRNEHHSHMQNEKREGIWTLQASTVSVRKHFLVMRVVSVSGRIVPITSRQSCVCYREAVTVCVVSNPQQHQSTTHCITRRAAAFRGVRTHYVWPPQRHACSLGIDLATYNLISGTMVA